MVRKNPTSRERKARKEGYTKGMDSKSSQKGELIGFEEQEREKTRREQGTKITAGPERKESKEGGWDEREKDQKDERETSRICIKNIPLHATEQRLRDYFTKLPPGAPSTNDKIVITDVK